MSAYPGPVTATVTVAVLASAGGAGDLADATLEVLAQFGIRFERMEPSASPDPAIYAVAIVIRDRACADRLARNFPGPVLLVPDGSNPAATLDAVRAAASEDPQISIGVLAAGAAGARNAALATVAMLAASDADLRDRYRAFREEQTAKVLAAKLG
jgi:5-(carboxyamino)imidazole ribonucleotide mutase